MKFYLISQHLPWKRWKTPELFLMSRLSVFPPVRLTAGGFKGCGHSHKGHPGKPHWSCCGNTVEKSECLPQSVLAAVSPRGHLRTVELWGDARLVWSTLEQCILSTETHIFLNNLPLSVDLSVIVCSLMIFTVRKYSKFCLHASYLSPPYSSRLCWIRS